MRTLRVKIGGKTWGAVALITGSKNTYFLKKIDVCMVYYASKFCIYGYSGAKYGYFEAKYGYLEAKCGYLKAKYGHFEAEYKASILHKAVA